MPEGDTIHRTAAALRVALGGRRLRRVELPRVSPPHPQLGSTVQRIEARGKHLLIHSDEGLTIHTHQRMTGAWHVYAPGQRWRRPPRAARVILGVPGATAVCFHAPIVEVLDAPALQRHPALRRLGPDLTDPDAALDAVVSSATDALLTVSQSSPDRTIGEVLLDQRVACGVGNIYRSEVLFLCGLDPATAASTVAAETAGALLTAAAQLLRDNLTTTARTTVAQAPAGSLWVYGRADEPCRRCGTRITSASLGDPPRIVYRCPACQPTPRSQPEDTGPDRRTAGHGPDGNRPAGR